VRSKANPNLQTLNSEIGGKSLDDVQCLARKVELNKDLVRRANVTETVREPGSDEF